jgi:hypothetical protein
MSQGALFQRLHDQANIRSTRHLDRDNSPCVPIRQGPVRYLIGDQISIGHDHIGLVQGPHRGGAQANLGNLRPPSAELIVTVTKDDNGQPFDWSKVTGKVMTIHSQKERPRNAYVAVQHRGWWFYIADDDQNSKTTFSLLNILFSLQAATGKGKAPLLTLPVGK